MKVKLMMVLNKKNIGTCYYGVKIQLTPRRAVFVAEKDQLFHTEVKGEAEIKRIQVEKSLLEDDSIMEFLVANPKVQVVII